jgi:hypothetical protein
VHRNRRFAHPHRYFTQLAGSRDGVRSARYTQSPSRCRRRLEEGLEQVTLAERDDVVEALAAHAAEKAFTMSVCLRRSTRAIVAIGLRLDQENAVLPTGRSGHARAPELRLSDRASGDDASNPATKLSQHASDCGQRQPAA